MKAQCPLWIVLVSVVATVVLTVPAVSLAPTLFARVAPQAALAEDLSSDEGLPAANLGPNATLHALSIPPAAFAPADSTLPYGHDSDFLDTRGYAGSEDLGAPVYLPQGAVVNKLVVWAFIDNGDYFSASLMRIPLSSINPYNRILALVQGTSTGLMEKLTDDTVQYATIDNRSYAYYVNVRIDDSAYLHAVKIVYSY
jgi:hypothetical protein